LWHPRFGHLGMDGLKNNCKQGTWFMDLIWRN
jgi:hypothetical protein